MLHKRYAVFSEMLCFLKCCGLTVRATVSMPVCFLFFIFTFSVLVVLLCGHVAADANVVFTHHVGSLNYQRWPAPPHQCLFLAF